MQIELTRRQIQILHYLGTQKVKQIQDKWNNIEEVKKMDYDRIEIIRREDNQIVDLWYTFRSLDESTEHKEIGILTIEIYEFFDIITKILPIGKNQFPKDYEELSRVFYSKLIPTKI